MSSYNLKLNDIADKVEVKPNAPIKMLNKQIYSDNDVAFKISAASSGYQLELNSISANKISLSSNDI